MDLTKLAIELGKNLQAKGLLLATAESCTGGMVAETITSVSGSSNWFERGFVTYSNAAKQEMLGVSSKTIETYGAVSEETAQAMAEGALRFSHAQLSLAVTGIAGPTGGSKEKPVGMVCFAWAQKAKPTITATKHFKGNRTSIRQQATEITLGKLLDILIT